MSSFDKTTSVTNTTIPFHNNINHKRRAKTPSFSSVLLDAIYHSIDDTETDTNSSSSQHNYTPKTATSTSPTTNTNIKHSLDINANAIDYDYIQSSKQKRNKMRSNNSSLETIDLRHAIMIDSWIENQPPQPQPKAYYNHHSDGHNNIKFIRQKSISNKSSKTASSTTPSSSSSSSSCFTQEKIESCLRLNHARKHETSSKIFNKTKLKALKIYSDLKKSKQQRQQQMPVSPGARIAAFLNSIFKTPDNTQPKTKTPTTNPTSECSSASSFSRSCLSKTTTSTEKSNRSVRFYPVNTVIFNDEDSSMCNKKSIRIKHNQHEVDHQKLLDLSKAPFNHEQQKTIIIDQDSTTCNDKLIRTKRIQVNVDDDQKLLETSKAAIDVDTRTRNNKLIHNVDDRKLYDLSKGGLDYEQEYRMLKREKEIDVLMMMAKRSCRKNDDDYEEVLSIEMNLDDEFMNVDDDGESCDSSDLFELENFSSIGVGAFSQELPVFGTTSLKNITY